MLKELRNLAYLSLALVAISYGSHSANAASIVYASSSNCVGSNNSTGGGVDCVSILGHMSASVVGTLSINENKALNFGNMAIGCTGNCLTDTTVVLDPDTNQRVFTAGATNTGALLFGSATGVSNITGSAGAGVFTISGAAEYATGQVYVSFATAAGAPIDFAGENNYVGNAVTLTGPAAHTFTADDFTISCTNRGADVYGHYCDGGNASLQLKVGATLHTTAAGSGAYVPGKYVGTYQVMVSY